MCGIAGRYDPDGTRTTETLTAEAAAMAETVRHRGPDDDAVWADPEGGLAFGHRRLAVVGLGPGGAQPMISADGRWVISYNGELYDHRELRTRLAADGLHPRGTSDTEILIEAVAHYGLDAALEAVEGMFGLALWDRRERTLHLARDRFGEKPLYYGKVGGAVAFASELRALSVLDAFAPVVDRDAVALYLRHNCVPAPFSIYRGIAKVMPGEVVTFHGTTTPRRWTYFTARNAIEHARSRPVTGDPQELATLLETALSDSVAARMVADVPVGAFLSGGIDSSLVVALMQQHSTRAVKTYTVGYADAAFDESADAAAVAAHLGTEHQAIKITRGEGADVALRVAEIWDEPFGDVSGVPMAMVSELARRDVTVALSGDGGDELFAGYNRHAWLDRIWRRAGAVPSGLRRAAGHTLGRVPPGWVDGAARAAARVSPRFEVRIPSVKVAKVAKVLAAAGPEEAYLSLVSYWDDAESMVLGAGPSASLAARPESWPALDGITEQMMWLDVTGYLPDDILTKLDRAAMAVSLETRVPFLDRGVFDLAWRLPMDVKLRDGTTKWLLRQVLARHVPPALFERPKMGFGFPIGDLLRSALRPWAEELLDPAMLEAQGVLDPGPVRAAWADHLAGRRELAHELWAVLALEAWLARWAPGAAAASAAGAGAAA